MNRFNKILTELKKGKVLLIIEDNGPGFPKNRESLTNLYVTLREKGTGWAFNCSRIIEEHNGKLLLEDSELGGAKIIIEFSI